MTALLYTASALLLNVVSALFMYLYLASRRREEKVKKAFFKPELHKGIAALSAGMTVLAAATFLYCFYWTGDSFLRSFMNSEVILWLAALGYIDLKERIIPNKLIAAGIIFWLILILFEVLIGQTPLKQLLFGSLTGGGICGGVLFVIALIVKSALGMGDVKMFFVIGLLYGVINTYSILLFSIFVMAVVSIVLLIMKRVTRSTAIPMAPFTAFGFLINVLMGM